MRLDRLSKKTREAIEDAKAKREERANKLMRIRVAVSRVSREEMRDVFASLNIRHSFMREF